jgi:hypothetical protein
MGKLMKTRGFRCCQKGIPLINFWAKHCDFNQNLIQSIVQVVNPWVKRLQRKVCQTVFFAKMLFILYVNINNSHHFQYMGILTLTGLDIF